MRSNQRLRRLASRSAWRLLWVTVFGSTLWVVSSGGVPAPHRCSPVRKPEVREQALPGKGAPGPEGRFVRAARSSRLLG
ncbi:MAG TPA: hypothetical protein VEO37_05915 [Thermoanaerobaculia bacterium]|nr:hypothetical protein [Thermoanaerobaculia bacterium]